MQSSMQGAHWHVLSPLPVSVLAAARARTPAPLEPPSLAACPACLQRLQKAAGCHQGVPAAGGAVPVCHGRPAAIAAAAVAAGSTRLTASGQAVLPVWAGAAAASRCLARPRIRPRMCKNAQATRDAARSLMLQQSGTAEEDRGERKVSRAHCSGKRASMRQGAGGDGAGGGGGHRPPLDSPRHSHLAPAPFSHPDTSNAGPDTPSWVEACTLGASGHCASL